MTLRLDAGAAAVVAGSHDAAASTIDGSAGGAPGGVDGGIATVLLLEILGAVSTTAAEIAVINTAVADQVVDVADDLGKTESAIADEFTELNANLW